MAKKDSISKPKPRPKTKRNKDYIYDKNIQCPNCDSDNTELNEGVFKCFDCSYIVKGIIIAGILGIFLYFIL